MSRSELNLWDWIYMAPTVILLNQYYGPLVDERLLLIFATVSCNFFVFFINLKKDQLVLKIVV